MNLLATLILVYTHWVYTKTRPVSTKWVKEIVKSFKKFQIEYFNKSILQRLFSISSFNYNLSFRPKKKKDNGLSFLLVLHLAKGVHVPLYVVEDLDKGYLEIKKKNNWYLNIFRHE